MLLSVETKSSYVKEKVFRSYLYVIDQQQDVLRHVEVTQVEDDRVTNHSLSQDAIDLQGEIKTQTKGKGTATQALIKFKTDV